MDYSYLEELLTAGQWKEADQETLNVMLEIGNREEEGWLDAESLQNFSCEALGKIDQLWVDASDGKFGFSAQKKIYVENCGETLSGQYDETAYDCFADKVAWRVNGDWLSYSQVTFDTTAPTGHLPVRSVGLGLEVEVGMAGGVILGFGFFPSLMSRFVECKP